MNTTTRTAGFGALALAAALALAGCATATATDTTPADAATAADAVTISDAWVKSADEGMSAAFGMIENTGDEEITVVAVEGDSSSMFELHETTMNDSGEMAMREKDGGFVIPAGETLMLEPGGNHIMLMDLAAPLTAGDEASFTLVFSDDSTIEFTAPVKDFSGANENYEGGDDHGDGDHDHSGSDD